MSVVNSPERREIDGLMTRLLDLLSSTISSRSGLNSATLRTAIGDLRASYMNRLAEGSFAEALAKCFTTIVEIGGELPRLVAVHEQLFLEEPVGDVAADIVQLAISYCLATEAQLILAIEFNSRDDVEVMLKQTRETFDFARELAADAEDSTYYRTLTALSGTVIKYLADTARPLARIVTFKLPGPMPALAVSERIYYEADRWEEIVNENKIVHPAFCPRELRGLSS